ncbi:phosphotransferase enzyme family protein [Candidatus Cyanaurora vandensis]|uniref:phosphotransferase enzyme family protein n=1 Tax=Candidatus Cyanaurora vandensis TaxID=2714958 RepID=UPI0025801D68|nr:phosphotransferase [Candidatus Cyanaurora vandensis]
MDEVIRAFALETLEAATRLTAGAVNETWRVTTEQGVFIVQALHPAVMGATVDAQAIGQFLLDQGIPVPQYQTTTSGDLHYSSGGRSWRVMTCLPGTTHRTAPEVSYLKQAGQFTARFHQVLRGFKHHFHFQIPHFHDTDYILNQLQSCPADSTVQRERDFFTEHVPTLVLPPLPHQIIHGDLKLSNFLFNSTGAVTGLVDLDTLMIQSLAVEMGDALRSWCTVGESFDSHFFTVALEGYCQSPPTTVERLSLLTGLKRITLELGMRYLQDYFDDCYFQWDPSQYPSRRAHNLARARRQIAVYQDIRRQEPQLQSTLLVLAAQGERGF